MGNRPTDNAALERIRASLLAWYTAGHRDFPWRHTTDPYAVLVSEVMLQQTQAGRVAERFPLFMARFPTASALAAASEADLLAAWSGLGYNRRALALRRTAALVVDGWPRDVEALERLPGIDLAITLAALWLASTMAIECISPKPLSLYFMTAAVAPAILVGIWFHCAARRRRRTGSHESTSA